MKDKKMPIQKKEPRAESSIIAALDIGSSKICCFIAEVKSPAAGRAAQNILGAGRAANIEVIGIGHQASKGVKSGTIIDLRAAETAVAHAVEAAELMARSKLQDRPIKSVFINVPGMHTLPHPLSVDVRISGHEVAEKDVKNALSHSRSVVVPGKEELIHVIPAGYSIDSTRGIREPRGMIGQTLGVNITTITGLAPALRHLSAVAAQNNLEIDGFCSTPYASGLASSVGDELQLGCTVIDIGGGTTSIAVFFEGKVVYSAAIPVGGIHVTNDLARGLLTSVADAERIKTLYGNAHATGIDNGEMIDVPPMGEEEHDQPNYVPRSFITSIIQPRIEETFELVRAKLVDSGISQIAGRRAILTGGASQLPGLCDIGQLILDKKIRLGKPRSIKGLAEATGGPAFSTTVGLLAYAAEHADEIPSVASGRTFNLPGPLNSPMLQKVTHWLKENW